MRIKFKENNIAPRHAAARLKLDKLKETII